MTERTRYISIVAVLLLILSSWGGLVAQSVEVPISKQYPLLLKSIAFDRSFSSKLEDNKNVVIGIVYQEKSRRSVREKDALVKEILDLENVCIRTGHHCAQPLMKHLGIPSCCRISFSIYNTHEDIDKLMRALQKVYNLFLGGDSDGAR